MGRKAPCCDMGGDQQGEDDDKEGPDVYRQACEGAEPGKYVSARGDESHKKDEPQLGGSR